MAKAKQLTRRQSALIEGLFADDEEKEQAVLDKHDVSRRLYFRWLADEVFAEQLDRQVAVAYRQSKLLIARNAPAAADRLVELAESGKDETSRKACLDIIYPNPPIRSTETSAAPDDKLSEPEQISPQTASRLLAALAEENDKDS